MTTPTPQTELDGFIVVHPNGRMVLETLRTTQDLAWGKMASIFYPPELPELRERELVSLKDKGYTCQPVKIVRVI